MMDSLFAVGTSWLPFAGAILLTLTCAAGIRIGARWAASRRTRRPIPTGSAQRVGEQRPATDRSSRSARASDSGLADRSTRASLSGMPMTLGRYELIEPIGAGAMGQVFLGRDPKINRRVAIKAVDLADACDPDDVRETAERFMREAEAAGRLNHPNIVTIYDVGETDGIAYIAMEYLEGRRLSDFTQRDTLLPPATVLSLLGRTADALHYAHGRRVVHRDIKPANIMYDSHQNTLKLTDFGIARLIDATRTRAGIVLGTPSFMSPEQLEGRNVNGHTDLFALGVTLFQLLTGQLPFRGNSMTKLMFVIANEPHAPVTTLRPSLPRFLDTLLDTALAKDPAQRFRSGAEMAEALRTAARRVAAAPA